MRVGILGCGAIGSEIAEWLDKEQEVALVALTDRDREKAEKLAERLVSNPKVLEPDEFIEEEMELVVECASIEASKDNLLRIIKKGKNVVTLSTGAFSDREFKRKVEEAAKEKGVKVVVPSGAIAGIDGIKAAALEKIDHIKLRTTKSTEGLGVEKEGVVFRGNARDAVEKFPRNINVSETLFLASGKNIEVEIVADKNIKNNIHEVEISGEFGRMYVRVENVPSEKNPKSSKLAALSAIVAIRNFFENFKIGV